VAFLADEPGVADAAVFGAVVLLAGACEGWGLVSWFARWRFAVRWEVLEGDGFLGCVGFGVMGFRCGMELTEAAVRRC
jgi:hypothetical protein